MNIALPITLHKNQQIINSSPAKYVVVKSGKRFGKTEMALYKLIKWACARPGGTFWYLTDTARHAEEIGWRRLLSLLPKHFIKTVNNNKLQVELVMGSIIKMMSADNPDYLRGVKLHGIVWEEAAFIKNGKWIWDEIICNQLGAIGDEEGGPAFFISSPNTDGRNWYSSFYEEALRKKSLGDTDWDAFHFTVWDNPLYRKEVIQKWKDEMTEDTWEVAFMANESAHAGQIINEFNYSLHVKNFENPKDSFLNRSIDWGISHPTACLWMYTDLKTNCVYVSDEYKKSGKGIDESCAIIKQITGKRTVEWTVLGKDLFRRDKFNPNRLEANEFFKYGVPVMPSDTRSVGYDVMKMFFKKNMILIHPKCKDLIREIKDVQWGDEVGEDLMDTLRYGLLRVHDIYFRGNLINKEVEQPKRNPRENNFNDEIFSAKPQASEFSWAGAE